MIDTFLVDDFERDFRIEINIDEHICPEIIKEWLRKKEQEISESDLD